MKKTLLPLSFLLLSLTLIKPVISCAQVTGLTTAIYDSSYTTCQMPSSQFISATCNVVGTGTVVTTDVITMYVNFGDGSDTTLVATPNLGGSFVYFPCNHVYTTPGNYSPHISATDMYGNSSSSSCGPYVFTDDCSTLSGTFYYDLNSDCIYDAGDSVIRYSDIFAVDLAAPTDTFWCGYTNDSGHYAINFPGGNYNVITDPNVYWGFYAPMSTMIPSCPASSVFALSVTAGATYSQNFGYTCNLPPSFDVIGDGSLIQPHPGDTAVLSIGIGNWWSYTGNLCSVISAFATLTLDPHLHYIGTAYSTPPTSVSGGILSWELNMWLIPGYFNTSIFVSVDTSVAIGDTLHNTVYISPITGIPDPDLTNNTALINSVVTAPFDPNGMSVCPEGAGIPGYIPYNSRLSYHVQFQNTGTAPAHTITIVDTLSNNVNMATLRILHPSAPVNMSISGNVVKFRFDNINLPDSADSPFGSIGMMDFGVMPKPGLAAGTQIWNKASIYFDYNAPVSTNSVLNTMDQRPLATPQINHANRTATVYPNPAGDEVFAKTSDNSEFTMTMMDMIGRTVATGKSANGNAAVNTAYLPTGIYLVNLTNASGKVMTAKVTIQH